MNIPAHQAQEAVTQIGAIDEGKKDEDQDDATGCERFERAGKPGKGLLEWRLA